MLPGDVLLVASFISYLGCFTKQYRIELLEKKWLPNLKKVSKPIPMSLGYVGANVLSLLTDDAIVAGWNNEGLPSDAKVLPLSGQEPAATGLLNQAKACQGV